jgi:type VI secretion system protein ImpA
MASPETIELEALLTPIPGENSAGEPLRYAGPYEAIQEARRADDDLAQGEWQRETKSADWLGVIALATEALTGRSKDLQIAIWMVEALVKRHGFAGLRDGLRFLRELQERFWETLYPVIEDGDLEARITPFEWLNEKLPVSLRAIPLTRSRDGDAYAWIHREEARRLENLARQNPEAYQAAVAEGKVTGEQFEKAVAGTPRAFYETLYADLNQSWEECGQLAKTVDEKFGREAPSLLNVKKALEELRGPLEGIVKKKRELEPDPVALQAAGASALAVPGAPEALAMAVAGSVPFAPVDRGDALRRLTAVAEFFRRTEPHSPVAYLVQRAVQWGQMPLEAWLKEVISDETVLARVRETLGLKDHGALGHSGEGEGTG